MAEKKAKTRGRPVKYTEPRKTRAVCIPVSLDERIVEFSLGETNGNVSEAVERILRDALSE